MADPRPIILILGPTAGSKTDLSLALARGLPGASECVCADSMQVYRGMDIGTAKPTAAQRAEVPHHLLDLLDAGDNGFSVDVWLRLARAATDGIRSRNRWPIVVGGTNLYVQALLEGLFDGPEPDPRIRAELQRADLGALRQRLVSADPVAARRIHRNDRRRTIRALEVYELTGHRISDLQSQWVGGPRRDVRIIGLHFSVEAINRRINARVRSMMAAGLLEEVRRLVASGGLGGQASEALGYRQLLDHLAGRLSHEEAVEQIKIRTRRLARQQRSWLRRFFAHPDSSWIEADGLSVQSLAGQAFEAIGQNPPEGLPSNGHSDANDGVSEGVS